MTRRSRSSHSKNAKTVVTPYPPQVSIRADVLDIARGFTIVVMLFYHFMYDLSYWQIIHVDFYHDPFWLHLRTGIVTSFLYIAGISASVAHQQGVLLTGFKKRLYWLGGAALLISIVSFFIFGSRFIFFGILHFITFASIINLYAVKYPKQMIWIGFICLLIGNLWQHPLFNLSWLQWLGMMTHKPFTEDYVPVLPWLGMVFLGISSGHILHQKINFYHPIKLWQGYILAKLGRYSLLIYLAHQPLFFSIIGLFKKIYG